MTKYSCAGTVEIKVYPHVTMMNGIMGMVPEWRAVHRSRNEMMKKTKSDYHFRKY